MSRSDFGFGYKPPTPVCRHGYWVTRDDAKVIDKITDVDKAVRKAAELGIDKIHVYKPNTKEKTRRRHRRLATV